MQRYRVECEQGVMAFEVGAMSLGTLCATLNLHNVTKIYQLTQNDRATALVCVWEHPEQMPFGLTGGKA